MYRERIMPCLLLKGKGLVKTVKFAKPRYIGDPINAVHIYNAKEADELVFLDITATQEKRLPPLDLIERIADECFMPFALGGGIKTIADIREILSKGAEKVVISTAAVENPSFIQEAADTFGSSTIVVCMDVKKKMLGGYEVTKRNASQKSGKSPLQFAQEMQKMGVGEIIVNAVDLDGTMTGYNIELIKSISQAVDVPVVALGGAGKLLDFRAAIKEGEASAVAAGSYFVYHGARNAVLINFPSATEQATIFE